MFNPAHKGNKLGSAESASDSAEFVRIVTGLLLHSQIRKEFRAGRIGYDQIVANGAVVGDGCSAFRNVIAIVAAEASGRIVVPDIVWMCAPTDVHRWKNICVINADQGFRSGINLGALLIPDRRILRSVKSHESRSNACLSLRLGPVGCFEKREALLVDKR